MKVTGGVVTLTHVGRDGQIMGKAKSRLRLIPGAEDPRANIVEVRLKDVAEPLYMRRRQFEEGKGALMPRPTPDVTTGPLAGVAFAFMRADGYVAQFGEVIGTREDVRPIRMFRG